MSTAYQQIKYVLSSRCVGCSAKQTLSIQQIKKPDVKRNIQGTFYF